jgi:hypothetical protein
MRETDVSASAKVFGIGPALWVLLRWTSSTIHSAACASSMPGPAREVDSFS